MQNLKVLIAKTAKNQAEQILANDNDDMGNPEELCKKLAQFKLKYDSIILKQKQESDVLMNEYYVEIYNNMNKEKITTVKKNYDDIIRLEVYDKYIQTDIKNWDVEKDKNIWPTNHPFEDLFTRHLTGEQWFNNFKYTINQKIKEKRSVKRNVVNLNI